MDLLADTEEPVTVQNLVENDCIRLSGHCVKSIARMALQNETLAGPLLCRDEVPKEIALRLYRFVGDELKSYISERFETDEGDIEMAIERVVDDIASQDKSMFMPSAQTITVAKAAYVKGKLGTQEMIDVLRRGDIPMFVAQFSIFAELTPGMVIDMLSQRYGQGLAIACKGTDIEKADFLTMYFLTQRVRKASRIANKHDSAQALAFYDRTSKEATLRLLENSRS
jgi:uncharacterized protein (DUF2336 family)